MRRLAFGECRIDGHTHVRVRVIDPSTSKTEETELLVDTGSTYSWIAKSLLRRLDIKPQTEWAFKTVDGRLLKRQIGEAVVECMGERATTMIVFAEESDANVLGVHALEGLRLEVDPTTKQLKRIEALLAI